MKNLFCLIVASFAFIIIGCSKSAKTASEAQSSMEALLKELAHDPESVKVVNLRTAYSNDSLSILHFDFTGKNAFGMNVTNKWEYIYLKQGDKKYEALHELGPDSIYVDQPTWEKIKKGNIYQDLDYDNAIRYLAATFINGNGRVVGDKSNVQEVNIALPTGTGRWELKRYSDTFGDDTDDSYLVLLGKGTFSNSATLNSELNTALFVDDENFAFRLFEYGHSPVMADNAYYNTMIKDSKGKVYTFKLWNSGQSGQIGSPSKEDYNEMLEILNNGGEVSVVMTYDSYTTSDYKFKMNVDGFNKAIKYLK